MNAVFINKLTNVTFDIKTRSVKLATFKRQMRPQWSW